MVCNIHQKFRLLKMLNPKTITHFQNSLLCKWGDVPAQDQYSIGDTFILHTIRQDFDGFHSNLFVFGEEDEELIGFVIRFFLLIVVINVGVMAALCVGGIFSGRANSSKSVLEWVDIVKESNTILHHRVKRQRISYAQ